MYYIEIETQLILTTRSMMKFRLDNVPARDKDFFESEYIIYFLSYYLQQTFF